MHSRWRRDEDATVGEMARSWGGFQCEIRREGMPQIVEDRVLAEQPSCSSADTAVEDSQAAVPREPRPAKRQKTEEAEDVRSGTVSILLNEEEHKKLLELERTFPDWPLRRSKEPRVLISHRKWTAIESEMRAIFPNLPVKKQTLRRICVRTGKQRELRELQRFKMVCTGSADKDVRLVVLDLENTVKLSKEDAKDKAMKLAASEERAAALQSALLERSRKCAELEDMVRLEKAAAARLKKQLLLEMKWRMAQLQDMNEVAEDAEGGEAAA